MNTSDPIDGAQPPIKPNDLGITNPSNQAAGIKGLVAALKYSSTQMGVIDGFVKMLRANQDGGFDCPSCAWPDPHPSERSSLGEYCENGAKAIADEATTKRVTPAFFKENSISHLKRQSDHWLNQQGRLTHPMYKAPESDFYSPIPYEEAIHKISNHLKALDDPNKAIFYTSGRTSNEAAFLYQLFVRQFGTNNLPDCSNMCHESSGAALIQTVGIGKGSVTLEDFYKAEVILILGQNPGTNHPRMMSALQKCKKNGGVIVSINPLKEAGLLKFKHPQHLSDLLQGGTDLSDIYLQIRINEDVALLKYLLIRLLQEHERKGNVLDQEFISEYTKDFYEVKSHLLSYDTDELLKRTALAKDQVENLVQLLVEKKKIIACWAMGLTQHKNAVDTIREVVNLLLLKGSIGIEGGGTCPVRGHSNVQGDRTMGIWEKPPQAFLDRLEKHFKFIPPKKHGYDTVEAIQSMLDLPNQVFFAMGGNFLSATPDTELTAKALSNCALTVQVSTKLNRSHLITGKEAIILPCLGRTEIDVQATGPQFVSVENSVGIVHSSEGAIEPASPYLKSEPAIVADLAECIFSNEPINWKLFKEDYHQIRNAIEACIPGFEDYSKKIKQEGGFYLPNGARERKFNTSTGKANFTINKVSDINWSSEYFIMMTIRSHDQFNTTIYDLNDRYRGIFNERRVVLMNPQDIEALNFKEKQLVDIYSHFEGEVREAKSFFIVPFDIPRSCVATYFPEANVLVPLHQYADISKTPVSKSIRVTFKPSAYTYTR